jgi:hypothetical protein
MFTPTDDSGELKFTPYEVTKKFHDFALDDFVIKNIDKKGYEKPTEIQEKTLQAIMDGRDMLGLANTGSGKTAAFLIPIIASYALWCEESSPHHDSYSWTRWSDSDRISWIAAGDISPLSRRRRWSQCS